MKKKTKLTGNIVEIICILLIYISAMCIAVCLFSCENEPLELIIVTGFSETTTEETTTTTTTTMTTTTTTTTTTMMTTNTTITTTSLIVTTTETTTTEIEEDEPVGISKDNLKLCGTFTGTFYPGGDKVYTNLKGGSGRKLIDCSIHGQGVKGSVASKYIYNKYKYCVNGRTKVYIEVPSIPSMTGWYYVDDCNESTNIVDFFYCAKNNCPFKTKGVIECKMYI